MPLRYIPIGAVLNRSLLDCLPPFTNNLPPSSLLRPFHTSRKLQDDAANNDSQNHYETLETHPEASHAEIKKSFYRLSKIHHPDVNPSDPHAPRKFHRISEAYAVLGHAEKRARYDRDFFRRHPHHHHSHSHRKPSSYHSSGPAGGRPASGLSSRRRSTFQGPPPSFYRSGGWGSQSSKRRAAHEESTGGTGSRYNPETNTGHNNPSSSSSTGETGTGGTGGMGPGQRPHPQYTHYWGGGGDDVPHFDKQGHERTHRKVDERRAERQAQRRESRRKRGLEEEGADISGGGEGDWGRVAVISGVIIFAMVGPAFLLMTWGRFADWVGGSNQRKRSEKY